VNKSEELCKLLGIKPKITCKLQCVGSKVVDKEGRAMCINHCSKSGLLYPDLTKPSNFVKLLILNPYPADVNSLACKYKYIFEYQPLNFIDAFIEELTNEFRYLAPPQIMKWHKNIQQQAQQTEWEY